MSVQLQHRRGTTAQHASFTGADGEITVDTTKKTVVVHDGSTAGGIPLAKASDLAAVTSQARPAVSGLLGNVNATTPTTSFDLSADAVSLRNSGGNVLTVFNAATKTVALATAGPAANGRDQSGAFSANSWIHLYWIYNTTTSSLDLLASTTAPASFNGSTLPTGYTYWAYATTIRWNNSSNIEKCWVRGNKVHYATTPSIIAQACGTSGTFTKSTASAVPPNALHSAYFYKLENDNTTTDATVNLRLEAVGVSNTWTRSIAVGEAKTSAPGWTIDSGTDVLPNLSQTFYFLDGSTTSCSFYLSITSYCIANGDVG